ncbi:MAG: metal-dependent hydrolase [Pseudomonadota bacterium]
MDTLTHALSGMLLARATAPVQPHSGQLPLRSRMLVGLLAGAFPDSDFVLQLFGDAFIYLNHHRGVTHSLPLLPLWALLLSGLFVLLWRRRHAWQAFYGVALLALGIHVAGDVITAFGTRIFAPFSDYRAALPAIFIIDLWFTGIIVAGLLAAWLWRSRLAARLGLTLLAAYVGVQVWHMQAAGEIAQHWVQTQGVTAREVAALPQPLSPFHWKLLARDDGGYHRADLNLYRDAVPATPTDDAGFLARVTALYRPAGDLQWDYRPLFGADVAEQALAREAWQAPVLAGMHRFAEYPALYRIDRKSAGVCVWFYDLRFELRNLRNPFIFGACRADEQARWRLERLTE